jgi:hypothetical protein
VEWNYRFALLELEKEVHDNNTNLSTLLKDAICENLNIPFQKTDWKG